MKLYHLPIKSSNNTFKLDSLSGSLMSFNSDSVKTSNSIFPDKLLKALSECNNPYLLDSKIYEITHSIDSKSNFNKKSITIIKQITRMSFWLGYKTAPIICSKKFENTKIAIDFFRIKTQIKSEDILCLPRSIFAAASSKTFEKNGVIFIGVFLPSNSMHAWIIEDGVQPDPWDTIWTNFQPVAAIC